MICPRLQGGVRPRPRRRASKLEDARADRPERASRTASSTAGTGCDDCFNTRLRRTGRRSTRSCPIDEPMQDADHRPRRAPASIKRARGRARPAHAAQGRRRARCSRGMTTVDEVLRVTQLDIVAETPRPPCRSSSTRPSTDGGRAEDGHHRRRHAARGARQAAPRRASSSPRSARRADAAAAAGRRSSTRRALRLLQLRRGAEAQPRAPDRHAPAGDAAQGGHPARRGALKALIEQIADARARGASSATSARRSPRALTFARRARRSTRRTSAIST